MATDRNGKPVAVDNLVRIPGRTPRVFQVDPVEWDKDEVTPTLFPYPGRADGEDPNAAREYLTGRVLALSVESGKALVKIQGIEAPQEIEPRLLEVTA